MGQGFDAVLGWGILIGLLASPFLVIKGLRAVDRRSATKNTRRLAAEYQRSPVTEAAKAERSFLKACTNCSAFALTLPYRDKLGRTFCSEACMRWLAEGPRSFCQKCTFETTPDTSGNLHTVNGIGTRFLGSSDECGQCGSLVRRVWVSVFYVPLVPLRRYRVIHMSPQQFLSRRVRA